MPYGYISAAIGAGRKSCQPGGQSPRLRLQREDLHEAPDCKIDQLPLGGFVLVQCWPDRYPTQCADN